MAGMILAKKFIFSISRSFPQTQSLFLHSSSSSIHKFSRATFSTTASGKKKSEADKAALQNVKAGKNKDMAGKTDQQAEEKQKHWKKPPEGWHVLSTDGSVREGIAGIGGLIRDNNGFIVTAFAAGIPTAPIHVIETKAIVEGVKIAMITNGVTKLIVNSDSMTAVDAINGRLKTPPSEARDDDLILLKSVKDSFTRFEVCHVCRKANRPADFLASFCKSEGSLVFNSVNIPEQLKVLAAQDATDRNTECN